MDDVEFKKYVELILSMCTDYLMGGITRGTFESNLTLISSKLLSETLPPSDSIFVTNDNVVDENITPPEFDIEQ